MLKIGPYSIPRLSGVLTEERFDYLFQCPLEYILGMCFTSQAQID